jgi:hypothetical protein
MRAINHLQRFHYLVVLLLPLISFQVKAEAFLEIVEFAKASEKKTIPIAADDPKLFNIEMFTSWSHCEVAAINNNSTKQQSAWLRCWSQDESQIAIVCQGNERQTVILGHDDKAAKRGSISLVCKS